MAKQPKAKVKQVRNVKNLRIKLFLIPAVAFLAKLIWISQLPGHGLYGADGESYIAGLEGLLKDGFFSTSGTLSYWPSGYPILMWPIAALFKSNAVTVVGIIQSLIYFLACAYFVDKLTRTRLTKFTYFLALILAFNPTLSMNSVAIGYETLSAAFIIAGIALLIPHFQSEERKFFSREIILSSTLFAFSIFMQPRLVVVAIMIISIWAIATQSKKHVAIFLAISIAIMAIGPSVMVVRNIKSMNFTAISTNLGITMNIGAGNGATGGYMKEGFGVPCSTIEGDASVIDRHLTNCVINWYLQNPITGGKLFLKKAIYFWSPWFGPVANGTMARNPWLDIQPLSQSMKTQSGFDMVYGNTGKLVSWAWLIWQLVILVIGFRFLWRADGLERLLGTSALAGVVINWLTSVATIGDHRFRIPTMTLSLFLQAIGFISLFGGKSRLTGSFNPLRWKSLERKANLLP